MSLILKKYWLDITIAIIMIVIATFSTLFQPTLMKDVFSAILNNNHNQLKQLGIFLIFLAVLGLTAGVVNTIFAARVAQNVAYDLRDKQYRKIQNFSFSNIEKFTPGNLVVRMTNDVTQVQNLIMMFLQTIFRAPIMFFGALVFAIITIPQFWWIIAVVVSMIVIVSAYAFFRMEKFFNITQQLVDKVNGIARESLMGIRVIKSFVQEDQQINKFEETSDQLTDVNIKTGNLFSFLIPLFFLFANLAITGSIFLVGFMVTKDSTLVARIASFVNYLFQIMFAIVMAGFTITFASRGLVSIRRIDEVFKTQSDLVYQNDEPQEFDGSIEFDQVSFTYPGDLNPILKNISFDIKPREMIGIVGATGSGKSTLAQLIARIYDPTEGVVKVGGHDLRAVSETSLRQNVSLVLQKPILFSGTVADNLRQGKSNASVDEMKKAAEISQAAEFINNLPNKFESKVEERSANFSGGQKQRLSIARGVIGEPKVLILDDSTSALDAKSEKKVKDALNRELKNTTKIIISEKISSVINADRIIVLDHGKVSGIGSHQDLVKTNQVYQEIYATQKALQGEV
ncbi:ABC transporter ATP-binding protein [Xylocopilactobacillus apis]|uniref:ABC transporter ATP-binding protein n=1 Tax=Xylocopilactobacillus apis TaxID=2932183 RepID=UPI002955BC04|nr:ABC transporter ATP-binding protein [Xylocopilactobacillus apis]